MLGTAELETIIYDNNLPAKSSWLPCPSVFHDAREPGRRGASMSGRVESRVE